MFKTPKQYKEIADEFNKLNAIFYDELKLAYIDIERHAKRGEYWCYITWSPNRWKVIEELKKQNFQCECSDGNYKVSWK